MAAVLIHTLADAVAALRAAAGQPVVLLSAPAAAQSLGIGGWLALVRLARAQVPQSRSLGVLDCGDGPGLALAALRMGAEAVRIDAPAAVLEKLADIAGQTGGRLFPPGADG